MNFECHVTVDGQEDRSEFEALAKQMAWKTSYIIGDPLLGQRGFFYFTTHHGDYDKLFSKMKRLSEALGKRVVREKIEQIMYDTKTGLCPSS